MANARYGGSLSANSLQTQKPKDLFRIVFKYYVDYANHPSNHRETPDQDLLVSSLSPSLFLVVNKVQRLGRPAPKILFTLREKAVDLDDGTSGNSRLESRSLLSRIANHYWH